MSLPLKCQEFVNNFGALCLWVGLLMICKGAPTSFGVSIIQSWTGENQVGPDISHSHWRRGSWSCAVVCCFCVPDTMAVSFCWYSWVTSICPGCFSRSQGIYDGPVELRNHQEFWVTNHLLAENQGSSASLESCSLGQRVTEGTALCTHSCVYKRTVWWSPDCFLWLWLLLSNSSHRIWSSIALDTSWVSEDLIQKLKLFEK